MIQGLGVLWLLSLLSLLSVVVSASKLRPRERHCRAERTIVSPVRSMHLWPGSGARGGEVDGAALHGRV